MKILFIGADIEATHLAKKLPEGASFTAVDMLTDQDRVYKLINDVVRYRSAVVDYDLYIIGSLGGEMTNEEYYYLIGLISSSAPTALFYREVNRHRLLLTSVLTDNLQAEKAESFLSAYYHLLSTVEKSDPVFEQRLANLLEDYA